MAMAKSPVDPYCRVNGPAVRVKPDDPDADLATLAGYARALGGHTWRYPDGKLAIAPASGEAPLVFGAEGATLGQTATSALSALREQYATLRETWRATARITRQARESRLDPLHAPVDPVTIADGGELGGSVEAYLNATPGLDEVARDVTGRRWLGGNPLLPVESAGTRLGGPVALGMRLFRRRNELVDRLRARMFTTIKSAAERLTPEELAGGYADYVEKGIAAPGRAPVLESVYRTVNAVDEEIYNTLKGLGVEVAPRVSAGPLNPTGRYFPHRLDLAALGDQRIARSMIAEVQQRASASGVTLSPEQALDVIEKQGWGRIKRERAVDSLIESSGRHGTPLARGDAERLLDTIIYDNAERISGNVERDRLMNADGYIKDFNRAYTATWTRNANRIADVAVLGRGDERIHRLLQQTLWDPSLGPRAEKFFHDVYDLEVGRKRVELSPIARELYAVQGAKLSLSVLANTTQGLNALMRTGLSPFVRAMGEAIRHPSQFASFAGGTLAERSGALPVQMFGSDATSRLIGDATADIRERGMAAMLGNPRELLPAFLKPGAKLADIVVGGSLAAFRYVENFNRSLSQRAGEIYFDQLVEQLAARGEAGLTHRKIGARLKELDFAPERVLAAVRAQDGQALREMRTIAGLRISNETQFKSNYQSMPLWASQSEPGKFMGQFKNYAIGQARFIVREIFGAHNDTARRLRAIAAVTTAYPAVGIALTSVRQNLMGPTLAGEQLTEALQDPTVANLLIAGGVGMTMAGGLGIIADIGMTAALGNDYALRSFVIPPVASSAINAATTFGSVGRAIVNGDPAELQAARAAVLREFGGLGGAIENRLRESEGRAQPALDPIEAVFGVSPFSS